MSIMWNYLDKRKAAVDALKDFGSMEFILAHTDEAVKNCLLSFFPNLRKLRRRSNTNTVIGKRNLAFFGDISRFECQEQYVNKVIEDYFPQLRPEDVGNQVCDLAAEVLINSQITVQKYAWFKAALITNCLALATTIILFIAA